MFCEYSGINVKHTLPPKQQKYIFIWILTFLSPFWICLQCNFSGVCLLVSLLSVLPPWLLLIYSWNKCRDVVVVVVVSDEMFVLFGESHKNKLDGSSERICKFKTQTLKHKYNNDSICFLTLSYSSLFQCNTRFPINFKNH